MAAAPKTLEVTARPSKKDGAFWSTSFWLFGDNPGQHAHTESFTVTSPAELKTAMTEWAMGLSLPADMDGWSLSVRKTSKNWPAGFKKAFERSSIIVVPLKAAA